MKVEWHIPGILPKNYPNMIVSPSGGGKTRLILTWLDALVDGRPILDRPTVPTKVCYIACDRPSDYTRQIMESLGIEEHKFHLWSFMDRQNRNVPLNLDGLFDKQHVEERIPAGTQLCFIEAIGVLDPGPAGKEALYRAAVRFGRDLMTHEKRPPGLDFLLSTHPPKLKIGEAFVSGRNSGVGSVGLPATCSSVIELIETGRDTRKVMFYVHLGPSFEMNGAFKDGRLILTNEDDEFAQVILGSWLDRQGFRTFSTGELVESAKQRGFSESTAKRWLKAQEEANVLWHPGHGQYQRRRLS